MAFFRTDRTLGVEGETAQPLHVACVALMTCAAVVALASLLGMDWLRSPVLGMPAGLWLTVVPTALAWAMAHSLSRPPRWAETWHLRPEEEPAAEASAMDAPARGGLAIDVDPAGTPATPAWADLGASASRGRAEAEDDIRSEARDEAFPPLRLTSPGGGRGQSRLLASQDPDPTEIEPAPIVPEPADVDRTANRGGSKRRSSRTRKQSVGGEAKRKSGGRTSARASRTKRDSRAKKKIGKSPDSSRRRGRTEPGAHAADRTISTAESVHPFGPELAPPPPTPALDRPATQRAGAMEEIAPTIWRATGGLLKAAGLGGLRDAIEERLVADADSSRTPGRALRLGIDARSAMTQAVADAPGVDVNVEIVPVAPSTDDAADLKRWRLDAILRQPRDGEWRISLPESPTREAAWHDWGGPRPITFASVFPSRLDPAQVTLGESIQTEDAPLIRLLLETSAWLSRHPARLGFDDRLAGRRAVVSDAADAEPHLLTLIEFLRNRADQSDGRPIWRAAARPASAASAGMERTLTPIYRCEAMAPLSRLAADEPEMLLRLAAAQLAAGRESLAHEAIARADAILRAMPYQPIIDPMLFLEGELELGVTGPMAVGRLAGAIVLAAAATPDDRLDILRDDFLDDSRFAPMLVDRQQDRLLLVNLFDLLQRARKPAAAAGKRPKRRKAA